MIRDGVQPCTLELMDAFTIRAVNAAYKLGLDEDAAAMLLVESDLPGSAGADELDRAERACERGRCRAHGAGAGRGRGRHAAPGPPDGPLGARRDGRSAGWRTSSSRAAGCRTCSTPSTRSASGAGCRSASSGTPATATCTRRSSSTATTRPRPGASARAQEDLFGAVLALGGSVTGEHGIGVVKRPWLEATRGAGAVRVMRAIKDALDPLGILNPGKVL